MKRLELGDLKSLIKSPLGASLLLVIVLCLILLTPKEHLPQILVIIKLVLEYILITVPVGGIPV